MITVAIVGLAAVAYRIATRRFTRLVAVLLLIGVVNFVMVWAQISMKFGRLWPETRYWIQSLVVFFGWAAWGVGYAAKRIAAVFRPARYALPLAVALFVVYDMVMMFKPLIPVGRRNAYVRECDWAVERIREDWKGPSEDAASRFSITEYHPPRRPVVLAHTNRVPYLLGGRKSVMKFFGRADTPDYVVDEVKKIELPAAAEYELMEERTFGKRKFALYRRKPKQ